MTSRLFAAALVVAMATPAPAPAQTYLDKMISRIGKKKQAGAATPTVASQFAAAINPAQTAVIDRLLALPMEDQRIARSRDEAAGLIRTVLATGSCAKTATAWNSVNRYHLTPTTYDVNYDAYKVPMSGLRYHDAARCLDVVRLADWSMPAANALRVRAFYIAADSGEARQQLFEFQKTSDSGWMIRDIGMGSQ